MTLLVAAEQVPWY